MNKNHTNELMEMLDVAVSINKRITKATIVHWNWHVLWKDR